MTVSRESAAREQLDHLAERLGVSAGRVLHDFCDTFDASLRHFAEVGFSACERSVAIMTVGHGPAFRDRLADWVEGCGVPGAQAAAVAGLRRAADDGLIVRCATSPGPRPHLSVYVRGAFPLPDVLSWLRDLDVPSAQRDRVSALATHLGAERAALLGAHLRLDGTLACKVYLRASARRGSTLAELLLPVLAPVSPAWATVLGALEAGEGAAPQNLFLSLALGPGPESLKLDLFQARLEPLEACLHEVGVLGPTDVSPSKLASSLGATVAEHCGIRLGGPTGDPAPELTVWLSVESG